MTRPLAGTGGLSRRGVQLALGGQAAEGARPALRLPGTFSAALAARAPAAPVSVRGRSGEQAVAWARSMLGRQDWNGLCERFVEEAYGASGLYASAAQAAKALEVHSGAAQAAKALEVHRDQGAWYQAPVGALLYFLPDRTNGYDGHAGIYIGNGRMISATPTGVREDRLDNPYYAGRFIGWAEPAHLRAYALPDGSALVTGSSGPRPAMAASPILEPGVKRSS